MEESFRTLYAEKKDRFFFVIIMFVFFILLSGCENKDQASPVSFSKHELNMVKENIPLSFLGEEAWKVPIQLKEGDFYGASGWIDDHTFLYITELEDHSNIYSYDLRNGENVLLYESKFPIVSLKISPSRKHILIHSSTSSNSASIAIINRTGEEIISKEITSAELVLEWNPFDESTILISTFTEDWEFSALALNMESKSLTEITIPQPFSYWIEKNKLLYLDWDENNPSFLAPLKVFDTVSGENKMILPDIYQVDSFGNRFMTISVEDKEQQKATYRFYDGAFEENGSFEIPHLTRFSDWLIPFYDYNEKQNLFITFVPEYYSEIDLYNEGFTLAVYDLATREMKNIFKDMNNEPINCSPNGVLCLYGHYYEKIINLKTKEVLSIIEE